MAQFASTLYSQTNPTNPALLRLRRNLLDAGKANARPIIGIRLKSLQWAMTEHRDGWQHFTPMTVAQTEHAIRVLTRLAALSG